MKKDKNIEVYSKEWCPYCKKAKAFLKSKGLDFIEYDIKKENKMEEMQERTGNKTVPQIIINEKSIGGYDEMIALQKSGEFNELLDIDNENYENKNWELIIIGAGPAALNAALYGARKGIDLLLIAKDMGGQVIDTNEIDNYLGKEDIHGSDLIFDFWNHVHKYNISSLIGEEVVEIAESKDKKLIKTDNNKEYKTDSVIIASGTEKRHLGMKQEYVLKGKGVHYCASCDGFLYSGQPVAVVGGGNSGLEASLDLAKIDCDVSLIEVEDSLMGDEYLQEKVKKNENITVYTSNQVKEIIGENKLNSIIIYNDNNDKKTELDVNGLFVEIGLVANTDFVSDIIDVNQSKEIIINNKNETNIKGIWAAGDVTNIKDKQIITSAAEGAKAALRVNEYLQ